jgi:DNA-binding transcriptional ArsR family regulator
VNSQSLDRVFAACSHPIRRTILERLAQGELSVGEATHDLAVTKPAITKHVKVLEEAGAIVRVVDGRRHRLALAPAPLQEARTWIAAQERLWQRKFDVVEQYLQEHVHTDPREEPA